MIAAISERTSFIDHLGRDHATPAEAAIGVAASIVGNAAFARVIIENREALSVLFANLNAMEEKHGITRAKPETEGSE